MKDSKPNNLTSGLSSGTDYKVNSTANNGQQPNKDPKEVAKEMEELKGKLEDLKKKILKKYPFTRFLSILPQQMLSVFAEDENMPREVESTNPVLLMMCVPEEKFKEIPKIKPEVINMIKESGQNIWGLFKTEVDFWHYGLDSKFDLLDGVSASYPLHDTGFLGALRAVNIHKNLILRKFERYVATYAIGGSFVRGVADKTSDVDTFIIIDDTDVKRMPRLELLDKLRGMINEYIKEATALAGVENNIHVQVYLLTDFWQSVKDANPVIFTFIRDGIPFYDRGTFIPWKRLLQMGKIQPSPESVDMFMKSGEQTDSLVKRRLIDAMIDIYYGVVTPTQALMMLAGQAPPEPKAIVSEVKRVLVDKEKLMSSKELKVLEKAVKLFKDYEHGRLKEISGKEIDEFKKESDEYVKKMKDLRGKIEDRMQEHNADRLREDVLSLLKAIFGNKSQENLIKDVQKELVNKGKIHKRMLPIAKEVLGIKKKLKGKKKISPTEMHKLTSDAHELMSELMEFAQRKDMSSIKKGIVKITYDDKIAEIVVAGKEIFLVEEGGVVKKILGDKFIDSNAEEIEKAIKSGTDDLKTSLPNNVFDLLKKELGNFEINL